MTGKAKNPSNKALQRFVNEGGTTRAGELARKKRPRAANQLRKSIVDIATGETEAREPTPEEQGKVPAAVNLGPRGGLKGGKARAAGMNANRRSQIAKAAAEAKMETTLAPGDYHGDESLRN